MKIFPIIRDAPQFPVELNIGDPALQWKSKPGTGPYAKGEFISRDCGVRAGFARIKENKADSGIILFCYKPVDHQLKLISDTLCEGSSNLILKSPDATLSHCGEVSNCSCPAAFSRTSCSGDGSWGDPISFQSV